MNGEGTKGQDSGTGTGVDEVQKQVDEKETVKHNRIPNMSYVGGFRGNIGEDGVHEPGGHSGGKGEEAEGRHLSWQIRQKRLKEKLDKCSKNRPLASDTVTSVAAGTSCLGYTASRRTEDIDDENTDDWQAELLHDVDEDTFAKLDTMSADLDEMATRERWLFCRSCKKWHTVLCSKTSSKFLMLSILGLLLQTRPINTVEMTTIQGQADYSIAASH
jgi:hypothetical protein